MTKKLDVPTLKKSEVKELEKVFDAMVYENDADVIYEGHIPQAGFILVEGLFYLKKRRSVLELGHGSLVGVKELYQDIPFKYSLSIKKGSKVFILDRSSIMDLLQDRIKSLVLKSLIASIL